MEKSDYDNDVDQQLPALSGLPQIESQLDEKHETGSDSIEALDEKADFASSLGEDDKPEYRNGEPVITTGRDVSRFAVELRDDGDKALTFRSIVLGTMFAGMGAALCQVSPQVSILPKRAYGERHISRSPA